MIRVRGTEAPTVKVTLALSRASVDFFRDQAKQQGVPYQRALVDEYARRHG